MLHRISPRGLLIENNAILFIEYQNLDNETYYALPGGGQDVNINLAQTLKNEFMEEVGLDISIGDVLMVREFILTQTRDKAWPNGVHQIEIIFDCKRIEKTKTIQTHKPDLGMTGYKWIPISEIKNYKVYPTDAIMELTTNRSVSYLFSRDEY